MAVSRFRLSPAMLALGALLLLGLVLRLWFIGINPIDPRFSTADDGDYYQRALRFAVTGQYIDDFWLIRPPLHVFFFAAIIRVGLLLGDPLLALPLVRGVQVALSLLVVVLGYDMARRLFNRRAGLVFAGVLALWFPLVEMPALFMSEPIFFYLLLAHMWLLVLWRDQRRWWQLALAGLLLGMAALTRSPALYAVAFVLAFVSGTWWLDWRRETGDGRRETGDGEASWQLAVGNWRAHAVRSTQYAVQSTLVFLVAFALVVGPWTYRNYTLYNRLILVDTLGPVNLWLSLLPERIDGGRTFLMDIPQAERSDWASEQVRQILAQNGPFWLVRNFWPHFQHIWKAQFVEDFFVKGSSYGRPLRESLPLGLLSDVMWFGIVALGLVGLTRPWREGAFRLVALGWIGYTVLIVGIMHVEPRYLLPIWLMLALYAAKVIGDWRLERKAIQISNLRSPISNLLALGLVLAFCWLVFS
ncbi:MAG: glycosyltransferase family 39 protein, partial [Chloroflexaceae bacterium]|nr:glycosyltransferase family 39 protein [Chloroflexaceae bacterium]